jgi:uncharacterized protein YecE (DUF72 family)
MQLSGSEALMQTRKDAAQDSPPKGSAESAGASQPRVRVGIGGWTYEPWRGNFYPAALPHAQELAYASQQLTAIEINGTFYGLQKPAVFAKWRDATPDDFVFSLKAPRFATHRSVLAQSGDSIARFLDSGIAELGRKLGPVLWQFPPTKRFERKDFEAFLALLPRAIHKQPLRHVLEVRHPSFMVGEYLELTREHAFPTVFTDSGNYPSFADSTGDFIYARLMGSAARLKTGYTARALDDWKSRALAWSDGADPSGLPYIEVRTDSEDHSKKNREVFIYFIDGAKERAPAAAMALLERLRGEEQPPQ